MKYKIIYNENHVDKSCKVCFGKFYDNWDFTTYYNGDYCYIKNTKYDPSKLSYGELDEYKLFEDILTLGEKFYLLFKDSLKPIFNNGAYKELTQDFVSNETINKKIKAVLPLCIEFISNYNIPICSIERNNSEYLEDNISVHELVNNIIMIYIINFAYTDLASNYEDYKTLYQAIEIEDDDLTYDVLTKIVDFLDNINGRANLGRYKTVITKNLDDENLIPIRYVTNLFTFPYETLLNNIASSITYVKIEEELQHKWVIFAKCHKCLSTLSKEVIVSSNYISKYKKLLCDKCKKINRDESVKNYENTKRKTYDYLVNNIYKSKNKTLIYNVEHLGPKDKSRKRDLEKYKRQLDCELNKSDSY